MKSILIVILFLITYQVNSQIPNWEWARSGKGNAEGFSIATDSNNNIYFTGGYSDTIVFGSHILIEPNGSNLTVFLTKYDSSGNVIWAKSAGGAGGGYGMGVATDNFGNVYVTGSFSNSTITFDAFTLTSSGGYDIFLVKYDSFGNVIWAQSAGGVSGEWSYALATDNFANIYITGIFTSPTLIFGSDTLVNSGNADIFLAKFNSSGNILWGKSGIGSNADVSQSVATDESGNVYITGYFGSSLLSFGVNTISLSGAADSFLAKYDSSGNALWAISEGGSLSTRSNSVATNVFGKVFITGLFNSPQMVIGNDTLNSSSTEVDVFIAQYDTLGNAIWARGSTGTGDAKSYCVATDDLGNSFVTGYLINAPITFDTITLTLALNVIDEMFIIKYDSAGKALFGIAIEGGGDDQNCITIGTDGSIFIGSDFIPSPFILGNDTLLLYGGESPFVAKLSLQSDVGIMEIPQNTECSLFPNPFSNQFTIKLNDSNHSELVLYDNLSRKLLQQTFIKETILNTEYLAIGIYYYIVTTETGAIIRGKIIKY